MSVFSGSNLSSSGLVFAYDMYNPKSYVGAPVTNLLSTPTINSVPTTGNGWGTYNTNQYGSGAYFSIGTVASVSGNIVTMTAAHSLRSYDVMQPQSSGGGVTGGTNYLIKKLSSTTFSLHPYNGSQDGSQGYINPATGTHKVYDDFVNDVRISINSSSFPTLWWGYPHLPNSGLVKEVRTNGCSIPGYPTTDCLRLYHTRPDGVTDGMAYGVDTPVTAGVAHTVSFWTKTVSSAAVGKSISYQIYNYTGGSAVGFSFSATLGAVGVWVKQSLTFTPTYSTCISYFFPSSGNIIYDLAHIQFEIGSVATDWTSSSRASTQALLDLTGKNTWTVNNLTYANNKSFSFNGSNSWIDSPTSAVFDSQAITMESWNRPTTTSQSGFLFEKGQINTQYSNFYNSDGTFYFRTIGLSTQDLSFTASTYITANQWNHIVCTYDGAGRKRVYINGIMRYEQSGLTGTLPTGQTNQYVGKYGQTGGGVNYPFSGSIGLTKVYNRALSVDEVTQNFNSLRNRYGV